MKNKFNIGDHVKYVSGNHGDSISNPLWGGKYGNVLGTVINVEHLSAYIVIRVKWDTGYSNGYFPQDIELHKKCSKYNHHNHPLTSIFRGDENEGDVKECAASKSENKSNKETQYGYSVGWFVKTL